MAATLVQPFLLTHRDKEVRLLVACCLADVISLYAPEIPYNEEQTKVFWHGFHTIIIAGDIHSVH